MRFKNNEKGQSLVEFSIILPIVVLILMGMIEFGMMLNSYLKIENAAREGARAGIVGSTDAEIKSQITTVSPGLDGRELTINVTPAESQRKSGDSLTVSVSYNYRMTVPLISNLFNKSIQLKTQTSMRIE